MKVLFIGGTGTISNACTHTLFADNIDLTLLTRGNRNHRIPTGVKTILGDIHSLDSSTLDKIRDAKFDIVVNFVAFDKEDVQRDVEYFSGHIGHYIFISSSSVYRKPLNSGPLKEDHPIGQTGWDYADRKAQAEGFLQSLPNDFNFSIIRPNTTYSEFVLPTGFPGLGYGLVTLLKDRRPILIHDEGKVKWRFTHNSDFAANFLNFIKCDRPSGEAYNFAFGEVISWGDSYRKIAKVFGLEEPEFVTIRTEQLMQLDDDLGQSFIGDKAYFQDFNLEKLEKITGSIIHKMTLDKGLKVCQDWYFKQSKDQKFGEKSIQRMQELIKKYHGRS